MILSENEALEFISENDVKFIRLAFCDAFGVQKNISILPSELPRAFSSGILIDATSFSGFGDGKTSDLFLFPDYSTLTLLPWRPSQGAVARFFCNIRNTDGSVFDCDGRAVLRRAVSELKKINVNCVVGTECEFYLFKNDESGTATNNTLDTGGFMDIAPRDKGENIRREICLTLEEMGIVPLTSLHERGPGQNEITFKCADPLSAADDVTTYKSVVETLSSLNGLTARFDPLPIPGMPGNGFHINIELLCDNPEEKTNLRSEFTAGIMRRISEITLFLNPVGDSYKRFGTGKAPKSIAWSPENRGQLIRMPSHNGEDDLIKLRSADPLANPYLAFALLIYAGLEGIENHLALPEPLRVDSLLSQPDYLGSFESLPESLDAAISSARGSLFVNSLLPPEIVNAYCSFR